MTDIPILSEAEIYIFSWPTLANVYEEYVNFKYRSMETADDARIGRPETAKDENLMTKCRFIGVAAKSISQRSV